MTTLASIRARDAAYPFTMSHSIDAVIDRRVLLAIIDEMRPYMRHLDNVQIRCKGLDHSSNGCTCGLDSLLSRLGKEGA